MTSEFTLPGLTEVPWESRNLQRAAFELDAAVLPEWQGHNVKSMLRSEIGVDYFVQLRVPANTPHLALISESLGFRTAELTLDPWLNFSRSNIYQTYLRQPDGVYPRGVSEDSISFEVCPAPQLELAIKRQIIEGSINAFTADRFHTDPHCPQSIADARIGLWLERDLLEDPNIQCTSAFVDGHLFGYIVWRAGRFVLGGVTPEFIGKGFAKPLYLESMRHVNLQSDEISTTISANNIEVLNLYSRLEFSFRQPTYVYHLWG